MSTILWIIAVYFVLDRLITVGSIGRTIDVTPGLALVSLLTGGFIVTILVMAAVGGVTP